MAKNPKYDNDYVTLGYLKERLKSGDTIDQIIQSLPKSYGSPPTTPYYEGSTLFYSNRLYRCKTSRLQGVFNWDDWEPIISEDSSLNDFIENTYSVDKIQIQEQLDEKIQTYYQETDPNMWTTDIEKAKHVGDYWYNTTNNTQWRFSRITTNPITYGWQQVNVPNAVFDLIDKKKSIYTSKPLTYKKDDMWIIEEELSDDDLPVGSEDNPIVRGDWVFSTTNSEIFDKLHWVKRDEKVDIEYIEEHYYNKGETDVKFEEVERNTDSKITKAKDEIVLNVSEQYTTKEEHTTAIKDFDTQIGTITETITKHGESISQLSVENGKISNKVGSLETITNNNYIETNEKFAELEIEAGTISQRVQDAQTSIDEINGALTTIESTFLEQTSENFTMWFEQTGVQGTIDDLKNLVNNQNTTLDQLRAYIRYDVITDIESEFYGSPYIELGKEDAQTKLRILDNRIQFLTGETETAYISNNALYINESTILTKQVIGKSGIGKWITEIDEQGNLNTYWGGTD